MIAKIYAELVKKGLKTLDEIKLDTDREEVKKILGITDETPAETPAEGETPVQQ